MPIGKSHSLGSQAIDVGCRYRSSLWVVALNVSVPEVTVPVAPGRNLSVLVESAVRNHLLRLKGYDASEVLIERQQQAILDQG